MLCGLFITCDTGLQYFHKFCLQKESYLITFYSFVITEDPIKRNQDENGVVFMNIYEFLLDKESLKV